MKNEFYIVHCHLNLYGMTLTHAYDSLFDLLIYTTVTVIFIVCTCSMPMTILLSKQI